MRCTFWRSDCFWSLLNPLKACHCVRLGCLNMCLQGSPFELFKYMFASTYYWLASKHFCTCCAVVFWLVLLRSSSSQRVRPTGYPSLKLAHRSQCISSLRHGSQPPFRSVDCRACMKLHQCGIDRLNFAPRSTKVG